MTVAAMPAFPAAPSPSPRGGRGPRWTRLVPAIVRVGLVVALAAPAWGATPSSDRVTRTRLATGLTLVVRESTVAPTVAVTLLVRAGTRSETAEIAGIGNFLQRVILRGTERYTATTLAEAAEDIGGSLDASGEADYASVHGVALARHWEALLDLIAEVALRPTFPAEEIEKERRLILARIRTRLDSPFPLAFDAALADLFGSHPYALPAQGLRPAVERVDRAALLAEYRQLYRPDRMVLAVSGDVRESEVGQAVGRLFGGMPAPPEDAAGLPAQPGRPAARRVIEHPAQQAQMLLAYLAPSLSHPDYAPVKVLSALLGGGMAGRLFVELRDRLGLAYSVGTLYPSRTDTSFLLIHLGTAPPNVENAETVVRREVDRIRTEPVTEDELALGKAHVRSGIALDRLTNARQSWYLAFFELAGVGHDFGEQYLKAVDAVTVPDILRVARTYLASGVAVILRPPSSNATPS